MGQRRGVALPGELDRATAPRLRASRGTRSGVPADPRPPTPSSPSPQVLFEELAGLYRFSKRPDQYSRAVPVREEIKWFSTPLGKATI